MNTEVCIGLLYLAMLGLVVLLLVLIYRAKPKSDGAVEIRPHWGQDQVRRLEDVERGRKYWYRTRTYKIIILILRGPFQDNDGRWCLEYTDWPKKRYVATGTCADMGIVPYPTDLWNAINALFRTRKRTLTEEELAEARNQIGQIGK